MSVSSNAILAVPCDDLPLPLATKKNRAVQYEVYAVNQNSILHIPKYVHSGNNYHSIYFLLKHKEKPSL